MLRLHKVLLHSDFKCLPSIDYPDINNSVTTSQCTSTTLLLGSLLSNLSHFKECSGCEPTPHAGEKNAMDNGNSLIVTARSIFTNSYN